MRAENFDFVSNFDTVWAVVLGAFLATIGGFIATQLEWYFERRRRARNAALFFGEVLTTLLILLENAAATKGRGDPYGPITTRMLRSARREIDLYDRNRESLYDLRDVEVRARIHTLVIRLHMPLDGIDDTSHEIMLTQNLLKTAPAGSAEHEELTARFERLSQIREAAYEFVMESMAQIPEIVKGLEPLARQSFSRLHEVANS